MEDDHAGQDLVFTFAPYTIEKNCNEYDEEGNLTRDGEELRGWVSFDIQAEQVDFSETIIDGQYEKESQNAGPEEDDRSDLMRIRKARIIFTTGDKTREVDEISAELKLAHRIINESEASAGNDEEARKKKQKPMKMQTMKPGMQKRTRRQRS